MRVYNEEDLFNTFIATDSMTVAELQQLVAKKQRVDDPSLYALYEKTDLSSSPPASRKA